MGQVFRVELGQKQKQKVGLCDAFAGMFGRLAHINGI
tara:strand:- start:196 stop:306 length:111 start_codon:yes stop_codon:yes gene_type:complete